ncbi:hypothetical protein HDC89_004015 [Herbaspirillum sp. SJZ102]|nr:hypothetical protein [Herbaspirillum sp. SJZ102]
MDWLIKTGKIFGLHIHEERYLAGRHYMKTTRNRLCGDVRSWPITDAHSAIVHHGKRRNPCRLACRIASCHPLPSFHRLPRATVRSCAPRAQSSSGCRESDCGPNGNSKYLNRYIYW